MPDNAPITHFQPLHRLSEDEQRGVQQRYPANRVLLQANESSPGVHIIASGFACRYVTLRGGERQILGFLVPGDLCDVRLCFSNTVDFSVATLTSVETTRFSRGDLAARVDSRPEFARELWRLAAVEDATARQWLLNVGHRSALERLAHLLCECFTRLTAVGLAASNGCHLPITQRDIADALALSPVHVNRTLMELRRLGLVVFQGRHLVIPDLQALQETAWFDPRYLQVEGGPFSKGPSSGKLESAPTVRSPLSLHPSGSTSV